MANALRDKVAVVTGSGKGIGRAVALAMANEGASVVVNDVVPENAEATTKDITDTGGQTVAFLGDIAKFEVAQQLIQTAVDNFGRIDILINNAGINRISPIWEMAEEDWDSVVDIHLKGTFNCTRHACRFMKEQRWGRIINTSSVAWLFAWNCCNYAAAKAGVIQLTNVAAKAMGTYGINVNCIAPGAVVTEAVYELYGEEAERRLQEVEKVTVLGHVGKPEDIANVVLFLASDESSHITGQVIRVDGGLISFM